MRIWPALLACCLLGAGGTAVADWQRDREELERFYVADEFRIFYSTSGKHALSARNASDADRNGYPDSIERLGEKLRRARQTYTDKLGFVAPLRSPRYRGKASTIDVHFVALNAHGSSGDGLHEFAYQAIPGRPDSALAITLAPDLDIETLTPEHELFHSVQYGYTSIKNSWLSEGTARWSESLFETVKDRPRELPRSRRELDDVLERSYEAKYFWRRIAQLCDTPGAAAGGQDLRVPLVRRLYENLAGMEGDISRQRGVAPYAWQASQKNSLLNNRHILAALGQAIAQAGCAREREVKDFAALVDDYLTQGGTATSRDVGARLQLLGNPFAGHYPDGPAIFARNIWDMQTFGDAIYLGAGNAANVGPAPNAGPVPIVRLEPKTGRFVVEGMADEEQIDGYRVIDGRLFVPGFDARENTRFGNFYRRAADGAWKKTRDLPGALHVFDMAAFEGKLFAALGTAKGAAVATSADDGASWQLAYLGEKQRVYNLMEVGGRFYAVKQRLAKRFLKDYAPEVRNDYFSVAEFRDGGFQPRPDLTGNILFFGMPVRAEKTTRLMRAASGAGKVAYIGAYYYDNGFGVFVASSWAPGAAKVGRVPLPLAYRPIDLLVRGNLLYILCNQEEDSGYRTVVLEARLDDPAAVRELFHFATPTLTRSFEEHAGDFYFGLGQVLKSQRDWTVEELSPATGNILKLAKQHANASGEAQ